MITIKKCFYCKEKPILYLIKVLNIETGQEVWACLDCVERSDD